MNWEAIGAVGEVVGAVAVVATLVYLSLQIRQNAHSLDRSNQYAQASTVHETNALYVQVFSQIAQDAELASIYHRALAGDSLDETEAARFAAFVNTFFAWLEDLYTQTEIELGFPEFEGDVESVMEVLRPYYGRLLETEAGREWWEADAPHQYSPPFIAVVNESLRGKSPGQPAT